MELPKPRDKIKATLKNGEKISGTVNSAGYIDNGYHILSIKEWSLYENRSNRKNSSN